MAAPHASADACGAGGAVVVAGTNAPRNAQGVPTGGVTGVGDRYASAGYHVTYVNYPTSLWPLGPIPYDTDVAIGKAATERAVASYQNQCPGRPVVVAGYSQGARIAGDVLSDVGNGRTKKIHQQGVSGELYSDPRRDGRDGTTGVENSLIGLLPGMTMSGPRPGGFGQVPVKQVCTEGDGVCDVASPFVDPLGAVDGFLGYFLKHGYYPARMHSDPGRDASWGRMNCADQTGATQDCVVQQAPSSVMLAQDVDAQSRLRGQFDVAPLVPIVSEVYAHRSELGLTRGPADTPSTEVPVTVGVSVTVAGLVKLDAAQQFGGSNNLTVGASVGLGMDPDKRPGTSLIPSIELARVETTVPLTTPGALLNPSNLIPTVSGVIPDVVNAIGQASNPAPADAQKAPAVVTVPEKVTQK